MVLPGPDLDFVALDEALNRPAQIDLQQRVKCGRDS
jgi:hypothetical protein